MRRAQWMAWAIVGAACFASLAGCGSVYEEEEAQYASRAAPAAAPAAEPTTIIVVQCPAAPGPCVDPAPVPAIVVTSPPVLLASPPPAVVVPAVDPIVHATMQRAMPKFNRCYAKGLHRNPGLAGKVVLRLQVDDDGEVDKAWVDTGAPFDSKTIDCLADEAEDLDFKRSVGSSVVYPLEFRPDVRY